MKKIIVGSRKSKLAVMQTELVIQEIRKRNPELVVEHKTFQTSGDLKLKASADMVTSKGLFVKELDQALIDGTIDLAVHSLKDVPMEENKELPIIAVIKRGDPRDALVLPRGREHQVSLDGLVIGSSSIRRSLQLRMMYPNVIVKSIRGNIQTRIQKMDEGSYDGVILAAAGLKRAGLSERISRIFQPEEMLPAAGQGVLAIQARKDFDCSVIKEVCDQDTLLTAKIERAFVKALGGGCSSPVAAYARIIGDEIMLDGMFYDEEREECIKASRSAPKDNPWKLAEELAESIKNKG